MEASPCLWMLIGNVMPDAIYPRREALARNEEGNGLELWRMLSAEDDGNDELVKMAGRARFLGHPLVQEFQPFESHDRWLA